MYPEKLLPESWEILRKARMAGKLLDNSDYPLTEYAGLTVMSILADCCAGTTRSRVTDRGDAYATVAGLLGNDPDAPKVKKADAHGQLVPISLQVIDASAIDVNALIRLRKREEKESGHSLRDLRHRSLDGLEGYVTRLANAKTTKADAKEIQRQFADDMKRDLKDVKAELGFARTDAFTSKEFIATVVTCAFRRSRPGIPSEGGRPYRLKPAGDSDDPGHLPRRALVSTSSSGQLAGSASSL